MLFYVEFKGLVRFSSVTLRMIGHRYKNLRVTGLELIIEDLILKKMINVHHSGRSVIVELTESIGLLEELRVLRILFALRNISSSTLPSKIKFKFTFLLLQLAHNHQNHKICINKYNYLS